MPAELADLVVPLLLVAAVNLYCVYVVSASL